MVSSPSEDEATVDNSRLQKYVKLDVSRLTAMDEEVRYSPVLKNRLITI